MSIVKLNNNGVKNATAFGSITGLGSMVFIKKLTASSSSTLSFVDGASSVVLDNTYKEYLFTFNNLHPSASGGVRPTFQLSTDGGSNYNTTMTTTSFRALHAENDSAANLAYDTGSDQAQGTAFQMIGTDIGNGNDESCSGTLHLFNPSSTTFVKHFIARSNGVNTGTYSLDTYVAGYGNTTSAVDAVQFKFGSGNIDAGDICLYGIA
jgi:hypothetical protein